MEIAFNKSINADISGNFRWQCEIARWLIERFATKASKLSSKRQKTEMKKIWIYYCFKMTIAKEGAYNNVMCNVKDNLSDKT